MIAKNKKGKSFGGCVRYVMNKESELLEAEGVLADSTESIIKSFAIQRSGRSEILQPVGHIPLSFSPEDSPRMTDEFMLELAREYMEEMGIRNTQYIVVRHRDTANDHLHIVYNRIDNDLKLISVNNDYYRNVAVCKKLKDKHKLTYGEGKENVKRQKLHGADKVMYEIYDEIKANLPKCSEYKELEKRLKRAGITIKYKLKRNSKEIQGVSFEKKGITFKGSEIDRKFSHANIEKVLNENLSQILKQIMYGIEPSETEEQKAVERRSVQPRPQEEKKHSPETVSVKPPKPERQIRQEPPRKETTSDSQNLWVGDVRLNDEQMNTLKEGGFIYLENMRNRNGELISGYVFTDDKLTRPQVTATRPDEFLSGDLEVRLMDKILVNEGFVTKAVMRMDGEYYHRYV